MTESPTTPPRDPHDASTGSAAQETRAPESPLIPSAPVPPAAPVAPVSAPEPAGEAPVAPPVLDQGTYQQLRTPRSPAALALDGTWHQISPRYVISEYVQNAIFIVLIVVAALVVQLAFGQTWVWIPAGLMLAVTVITLIILPRQARAMGYMLREDDVVFRRGILWQRMVAVPYGRMQLVDITQGPLDRAFGISQLKMVTAAATTGVQIPGLTQDGAEALRDTLIQVAETRRTGL